MKNIVLIDMSNDSAPSGVNRYIECLIKSLEQHKDVRLHWIRLLSSSSVILHRTEQLSEVNVITIPMPEMSSNIVREPYWMANYTAFVLDIVKPHLQEHAELILHLHTLNVINLALRFKEHYPHAKIITHLHCIPWKSSYNNSPERFSKLYRQYYLSDDELNRTEFETNFSEYDSYALSDRVITVTKCAKEFLQRVMKIDPRKISVIPNGMADHTSKPRKIRPKSKRIKLLFVGAVIPSKGVEIIARAMRKAAQKGVRSELYIAGVGNPGYINKVRSEYKDLKLHFLGKLSFDDLKKQYKRCDVGVLASLQEQSSYAAIEMAMFGLPIITTAVDGLDEMFDHGVNALKVPVSFNDTLEVDVDIMADHIVRLASDVVFARHMSHAVREHYLSQFSLERMTAQTYQEYLAVLNAGDSISREG